MSIGNKNTQGDKKSNFGYQLAVLELLGQLVAGGGGCCPQTIRQPNMFRSATTGTVTAGKRSASFFNAGATNTTVLGAILKPGEMVTFSAESTLDVLTAISYDGTGSDLLITTLT